MWLVGEVIGGVEMEVDVEVVVFFGDVVDFLVDCLD